MVTSNMQDEGIAAATAQWWMIIYSRKRESFMCANDDDGLRDFSLKAQKA